MPWISVPKFKGKLYVPLRNHTIPSKHACQDCFTCQMCSDERCSACLSKGDNVRQEKTDFAR